jgi:GTPase SAR1 family protein
MIIGTGHYRTLFCHKLKDWKGSDHLPLPLKEIPFLNKVIQHQQKKI